MKKIHLIGNAHLDPVWLWQWQEGYAEVKATFRSALDRMKEFDDFKFTSACSLYYMWIEESDKSMFDEIAARVKEGRWEIVGGWLIQPDCNIPCGESFARQALISQRYFKEKFGITAKSGYCVDSFGHNGNLPKILQNSGMENYVFMRPGPHEKELQQSLFRWVSSDGSCVKAYRIPNRYCITKEQFQIFGEIADMEEDTNLMAFYGVGNHGGGPTVALLDHMHRDLDERFVYSTVDDYFDSVKDVPVPELHDDLQYHAKGCYSACASIKADNRLCENALINAEKYSILSKKLIGTPYPADKLNHAWKNVLFNQFHDILGGCSIREAYADAAYQQHEAMSICQRIENFALQQISWNIDTMDGHEIMHSEPGNRLNIGWNSDTVGTPIVVFNPLPHPVTRMISVRRRPVCIRTNDGELIPTQLVRDSRTNGNDKFATAFIATIPAMGYSLYRMFFREECVPEFESPFITSDHSIENSVIRLELNPDTGEIISIIRKDTGIELLSGDSSTVFIDETTSDTWSHGITQFKDVVEIFTKGSVKLIENGPVRATLRSTMRLGNTEIIRDYSIFPDREDIQVQTRIDFHEKHRMLKFCLPINIANPMAYCQIPYGYIQRPTDGTEQVGGSWMALIDGSSGIGLANDSKYSFDADGSTLNLTVLRGAIWGDHYGVRDEFCEFMDQGIHRFTYTIFPFRSIHHCEKAACELNNPPTAIIETFHHGPLPVSYSGISVSHPNIIVTACKQHEDSDGIVLRCCEVENKDTAATISLFGTTFQAEFSHSQVRTFLIQGKSVTPVDFMEWKIS